jgi:hypothetical protein
MLREADLHLPKKGWGRIILAASASRAGTAWTDHGTARQERGLKHRADNESKNHPDPTRTGAAAARPHQAVRHHPGRADLPDRPGRHPPGLRLVLCRAVAQTIRTNDIATRETWRPSLVWPDQRSHLAGTAPVGFTKRESGTVRETGRPFSQVRQSAAIPHRQLICQLIRIPADSGIPGTVNAQDVAEIYLPADSPTYIRA